MCSHVYSTRGVSLSERAAEVSQDGLFACQCGELEDKADYSHCDLYLLTVNVEPLFLSGIFTPNFSFKKF